MLLEVAKNPTLAYNTKIPTYEKAKKPLESTQTFQSIPLASNQSRTKAFEYQSLPLNANSANNSQTKNMYVPSHEQNSITTFSKTMSQDEMGARKAKGLCMFCGD